jgi:enoyl-[acyl-carrier protein] reductase II
METDPNVTPEELLAFGGGALRKAVQEGDIDGSYMAGECAGLIKQIEPASAIVEDIILGAEKVMKERMERLV